MTSFPRGAPPPKKNPGSALEINSKWLSGPKKFPGLSRNRPLLLFYELYSEKLTDGEKGKTKD